MVFSVCESILLLIFLAIMGNTICNESMNGVRSLLFEAPNVEENPTSGYRLIGVNTSRGVTRLRRDDLICVNDPKPGHLNSASPLLTVQTSLPLDILRIYPGT